LITSEIIAQFVDPNDEEVMVCERVNKVKAFGPTDNE